MKTAKYKSIGRIGFFDKDETSAKLSKLGNPLEKLHTCTLYEVRSKVIDFEMFTCTPYEVRVGSILKKICLTRTRKILLVVSLSMLLLVLRT